MRHRHSALKVVFALAVTGMLSAFVIAPLAMMALCAFVVIVPALPFVIVPFLNGTWQGRPEPSNARVSVRDVTPHRLGAPTLAHA